VTHAYMDTPAPSPEKAGAEPDVEALLAKYALATLSESRLMASRIRAEFNINVRALIRELAHPTQALREEHESNLTFWKSRFQNALNVANEKQREIAELKQALGERKPNDNR
jgi:hypothetical protein